MNKEILYPDESYRIMGACFEVYKEKGCGFLKAVYQECLEKEFQLQRIAYAAKIPLRLEYKGHSLKTHYEPDFLCFGKIIVELKAVSEIADEHRAQIQNYLKAGGYELGILVNFGHFPKLQYERFANTTG